MHPEIRKKRDALVGSIDQMRWCDDRRLTAENEEDVAPGGFISPFGWYVVGTTIGGNAIVVAANDPAVYFADHTWYAEGEINYQDLSGDRSWICLPLTPEGVRKSLFQLAESIDAFLARAGEIDAILMGLIERALARRPTERLQRTPAALPARLNSRGPHR